MASSCSPKNIHTKLDDLSISSPPENGEGESPQNYHKYPTKSLLSKSLAENKFSPHADSEPQQYYLRDLDAVMATDHPEPIIMASSVGKDLDGRLIPSSSTISLLSLNNNTSNNSTGPNTMEGVKGMSPAFSQMPQDKMDSFPLKSRNSITHLNQQRLQPYQRIASPGIPQGSDFTSISSPKNIPNKNPLIAPDSPNLDPTSLGGSPSRFWLSSQTPPKSLSNSWSKSRTQIYQPGLQNATHLHQVQTARNENSAQAINIQRSGGDSPVLIPVQTPSGELPMTPLYLNHGQEQDSYFVLSHPQNDNSRDQ